MRKTQHLPMISFPEVTLTKKQAEALKKMDSCGGNCDLSETVAYLVQNHGTFKDTYKSLNNVPLDYLIKVLATREYHVEETFEDWLGGQVNRVVDGTPASCAYKIVLDEYKKRKASGEEL